MILNSLDFTNPAFQTVAVTSSDISNIGVLIVAALCALLPLIGVAWAYKMSGGVMHAAFQKAQDLRNRAGKFTQKQAMNSKAGQAMKGGWQQYKQKQFLEGKGVQAKLLKNAQRFMPRGARGEMVEQLTGAGEKLREQQLSTTATALTRNAGAPLSAHLARIRQGQSVEDYESTTPGIKHIDRETGEERDGFSSEQRATMKELVRRFDTRVGSANFRMSALMAAHTTGSDYKDVEKATEATAKQLLQEKGSVFDANNVMIETIAKSAKANGFQGLGYAGLDAKGSFSTVAIKLGGIPLSDNPVKREKQEVKAARSVIGSISVEAMEKGQLVEYASDGKTIIGPSLLGKALIEDATDSTDELLRTRTAQKIAQALRNPKIKHGQELETIVQDADAKEVAAGRASLRAEIARMVKGEVGGIRPPSGGTTPIPSTTPIPPSSPSAPASSGSAPITPSGIAGSTWAPRPFSSPPSTPPGSGTSTAAPPPLPPPPPPPPTSTSTDAASSPDEPTGPATT